MHTLIWMFQLQKGRCYSWEIIEMRQELLETLGTLKAYMCVLNHIKKIQMCNRNCSDSKHLRSWTLNPEHMKECFHFKIVFFYYFHSLLQCFYKFSGDFKAATMDCFSLFPTSNSLSLKNVRKQCKMPITVSHSLRWNFNYSPKVLLCSKPI